MGRERPPGVRFQRSLLAAALLGACRAAQPPPEVDLSGLPAPHPLPARATALVGPAHLVRSPPPPPPPVPLLSGDLAGWAADGGEAPTIEDGALCVSSDEAATLPSFSKTVAVEPGARLSFQGRVRAAGLRPQGGSAGAGVRLELLDEDGEVLSVFDDMPRQLGDSDGWQELGASLEASSRARSLRLTLEAAGGEASGQACFDDIKLSKTSSLERFLTLPRPREASHPLAREVTLDRITRPSLLAPGGATWALPVDAGADAQLRFAVGLLPDADPQAQVCFSIWEAPARRAPLWRRCFSEASPPKWEDRSIALPAAAGRTLLLDVTVTGGEAVGVWGDPRVVAAEPAAEALNLVLVVIDTLRADHLNVEGYTTRSTSPQLDAFAEGAIRYRAAQAASGWTAPSLGSVVTGELPAVHRAGRRRVRAWAPESTTASKQAEKRSNYLRLTEELPVLAERLREAGYETVGFSANNFFGPRIGFHRGFSQYHMVLGNNIIGARHIADRVTAWRAARAAQGETDPFFLTVHVIDPHHPYRMRAPYLEGYDVPDAFPLEEESEGGVEALVLRSHSDDSRRHPEQALVLYDAEIRHVDRILAPLVADLADEHTAVILLSDHGEGFGEHNHFIHGNNLYQELLHVPLWVYLPGQPPAVIDTPVSLADVFPTFLQLAGLPLPAAGRPLPLDNIDDSERIIISEGMYSGAMEIAARQGRWKYIRELIGPVSESGRSRLRPTRESLHDLDADPGEALDIADDQPERLAGLRAATVAHLSAHLRGVHVRCPEPRLATVSVDATIGQVQPVAVQTGWASVSTDRSTVTLRSSGPFHAVIQTTAPAERIELEVAGETWFGLAPAPSAAAEVSGCQLWSVSSDDQAGEMSESDAEELRALGYLE